MSLLKKSCIGNLTNVSCLPRSTILFLSKMLQLSEIRPDRAREFFHTIGGFGPSIENSFKNFECFVIRNKNVSLALRAREGTTFAPCT